MIARFICLFFAAPMIAHAGVYPPAAGSAGSTAIGKDDAVFVNWANGNATPQYGTEVDTLWKTPQKAWGKATTDIYDIVCLGNGGRITMFFPHPIRDGAGADFAVFENSFSHTFLELGFVEVSSDGVNFFRFASISDTPGIVGAFGTVNPTNIHNLAGKYKGGFGTPFDLSELPSSPLLDKQRICFVRIVDIIGDGTARDSRDLPIYDPWPTDGSGGFDLDAIGVIHQNDGPFTITRSIVAGSNFDLAWQSNPGSRYRLETSVNVAGLPDWTPVQEVNGSTVSGITALLTPRGADPRRFWRVIRLD